MMLDRRLFLTIAAAATATPAWSASPTPRRRFFTSSDGVRLSYIELGRGRPVLLLHGFLGNAISNWFDIGLPQRLAAGGRRVIAPDFRGHGQSEKPVDPRFYPPDVLARDQEELLRHLRLRSFDLAGYSLGARTAVRILARGARPGRVVLGGMGEKGIVDVPARRALFEDLIRNGPKAANPQAGAFVAQWIAREGLSKPALLGVLAQQQSTKPQVLARLRTPIGIVNGAEDRDNGDPAALARLLPNARLTVVPGTHLSALRTPELVAAYAHYLLSEKWSG